LLLSVSLAYLAMGNQFVGYIKLARISIGNIHVDILLSL